MKKCPRCKLPQEGKDKCQYCGYILTKNNKKYNKTIRKKLKNIIDAKKQDQKFAAQKLKLTDKGGRRSGNDRRKLFSMNYFPEKRLGEDRRKRPDRRSQVARKRRPERRFSLNHRKPYPRKTQGHIQNAILK